MEYQPIAYIHNDFPTKFGLPRQSGLSEHLISQIVMEKEYRNPDAFRGIEEFEYLWLIWCFAPMGKRASTKHAWSPTVRPPKLGGNKRMGVFATRSPNRPNPIGLTRVKLLSTELTADQGLVLTVAGADLMDGTAILDIKPYLPYADSVPDAATGNYGPEHQQIMAVTIPDDVAALFREEQLKTLTEVLSFDPRPGYQHDPDRVYGFAYGGYDVRFQADDHTITVVEAVKLE
ncbi:tRNA (N6-threonylcarbamoyladenosine(37)-N6)-methyltransferase TrmO [Ruminococcus sp.]|uniref:tRNA (N6-threonylcarbamoyladenosine(37)-N6)-methyltransferase TrmO n=1 Tax=Ruminococcus sp. TaxID=41978 RepID=UPI00386AA74D